MKRREEGIRKETRVETKSVGNQYKKESERESR